VNWRKKRPDSRPIGERKLPATKINSDVNYKSALPTGQQALALLLMPKEDLCLECEGVGVRNKKVCSECRGAGIKGEYQRVSASQR
jgi:DnaJ-class molecular chaperone